MTLIELIIVLMIIVILIGAMIAGVLGFRGGGESIAYDTHRAQILDAVMDYWTAHEQTNYPLVEDTTIIDLCLLMDEGYFTEVPISAAELGDDDNCGNQTCPGGHYVWHWDDGNQRVYSRCHGEGCTSNTTDGYQGVWP